MRGTVALGVSLALVVGIVLLAGAPGLAQIKTPPDFVMQKGESSPGPVTFSHDKHKAKVEKCTTCHAKMFKMKRGQSGPITLEALQQGKFCGSCHDGKTKIAGTVVFAIDEGCTRCHPP